MKYKKIKLNYEYSALEPYIDELTVKTHYEKHHSGYESKFNEGAVGTEIEKYDTIEDVLLNYYTFDYPLRKLIKSSGGGLYNHNIYWNQFVINRDLSEKEKNYLSLIKEQFGSIENFKDKIINIGMSLFGSGWLWVVCVNDEIRIVNTPNQESPLMKGIRDIVLGIDLWEHSYYLKYKSNRKEYIENILKLTFLK